MIQRLGIAGLLGVLLLFAGIALVAWENIVVAGGLSLVIAGLGLVVYGMVSRLVEAMGMGGLV